MLILANFHHRPDTVFPADVAGIDPDLGRAALRGGNGKLIVEMYIRHQRQRALPTDIRKGAGSFHIGNCQPGDLTARSGKLTDLLQASLHIRGFGVEHGLDHHRGSAADGDTAH